MSPRTKLVLTAVMFALAVALTFLAGAVGNTIPLFAAFAPLLVVPWALSRPGPGEVAAPPPGMPPASGSAETPRLEGDGA